MTNAILAMGQVAGVLAFGGKGLRRGFSWREICCPIQRKHRKAYCPFAIELNNGNECNESNGLTEGRVFRGWP
jgi:hypothetical protein